MDNHLHHLLSWLARLPRSFVIALTLVLYVAVICVDYLAGTHFSVSLLYCAPLALAAWRLGRSTGIGMAVLSAITLALLNPHNPERGVLTVLAAWDFVVAASVFVLIAVLISEITRLLERERTLARTDVLTGARNRLAFMADVDQEILRSLRHGQSLSLIYIDLDNFKGVNDRLGHREGDRLLQAVGQTLLQTVRGIDSVARLGGDEFVVLLPNADSEAAGVVAPRLREALLDRMLMDLWPVTFSIGVLTCPIPPASAEQLIHRADELMFRAKQSGKDRLVYSLQSA